MGQERTISYNVTTGYYYPCWRIAGSAAWRNYIRPKTMRDVRFKTRQAAENYINRRGGIHVKVD